STVYLQRRCARRGKTVETVGRIKKAFMFTRLKPCVNKRDVSHLIALGAKRQLLLFKFLGYHRRRISSLSKSNERDIRRETPNSSNFARCLSAQGRGGEDYICRQGKE